MRYYYFPLEFVALYMLGKDKGEYNAGIIDSVDDQYDY